jgi:CheY-like chemotaxis protein
MSTILLVDDETDLLDLYSEVLELMGHAILRAYDGEQALRLARQWHPDLVVTDWMMPRMDGVELCRALSRAEELRDIPVVMHSGSGNPHAPGVRVFLPKDCDLSRFEDAVAWTLTMGRCPLRSRAPPGDSSTPAALPA